MSDESKKINNSTSESADIKKVDVTRKRKRVKRIKIAIIITVIVLCILPTILCMFLGIQLYKLQKQVDNLFPTYTSESDDREHESILSKYVYASTNEHTDEDIDKSDVARLGASEITKEDKSINTDDTDIVDDIIDDGTINDDGTISDDGTVIDSDNINDNIIGTDPVRIPSTNKQENTGSTENTENIESTEKSENTEDIENTENTENTEDIENTEDTVQYYRDPEGIYYDKKVYLTFDDGPSNNTDTILDALAVYNIKATFFVVGHEDEASKDRYRRIVNEGHTLAIHSFSHKYNVIYKSIEDFDKDFTKLWELLYDTTKYTPTLYRFPGGSLGFLSMKEMKIYVNYLNEKGMTYYDWNVVNGDGEGKDYTEEQMIDNVLNGIAGKKTSIVLMHDGYGKEMTAETLPKILDALVSGGAEVLPMDNEVPLIQQIKATSLK